MTNTTKQAGAGITCACGRWFKNRLAYNPHWPTCEADQRRSATVIADLERKNTGRTR